MMITRIILVTFSILILLFSVTSYAPANAQGIIVMAPSIKNIEGTTLTEIQTGQQVVLSTTISNENDVNQQFTSLFEVRDTKGITIYLSWLSGTLHPNDEFDVGLSWTPQAEGSYEIRTFIVSDLKNPNILSDIESSSIQVGHASTIVKPSVKPSDTTDEGKSSEVNSVTELYVAGSEGDGEYQAGFSLMDEDQNVIGADGSVHFLILDPAQNVLYEDSFAVNENEFQTYTRLISGVNYFAYVWSFPVMDVKKATGEWGTAKLIFTDNDNKVFSTEGATVDIPTFTGDEIKQVYEQRYLQTATKVGEEKEDGNFNVVLERIGMFTHLQYDTWGDEVADFRADFTITNIGNEKESFAIDYVILDNAGNQYDANIYSGTVKFDEIHPGITIKGYQLFEDFDGNADKIKLIVSKYNYPTDNEWVFDIDL